MASDQAAASRRTPKRFARGGLNVDLNGWRDKIDEIDRELVELLNRRAEVVLEIALIKKRLGLPIYEPRREDEIFRNIAAVNHGPLGLSALRRIFERIIDESRSIQRGPMGAKTDQSSDE